LAGFLFKWETYYKTLYAVIVWEMVVVVAAAAETRSSNLEYWEPSQLSFLDAGKPKKTCAEEAGHRTFGILTYNQQSS